MHLTLKKLLIASFIVLILPHTAITMEQNAVIINANGKRLRAALADDNNRDVPLKEEKTKRQNFEVSHASEDLFSVDVPLRCNNWSTVIQEFNKGDQSKRAMIFAAVHQILLQPHQTALIALNKLIPNANNSSNLTSQEMSVLYTIRRAQKIAITKDFVHAIIQRASQKDADAQYVLARMYFSGTGIESNLSEAVEWCIQSATQDHAGAQFFLGRMYHKGKGVNINQKQAAKWLTQAANKGLAVAQVSLGRLLFKRTDAISSDQEEALTWYLKAAIQGHAQAQYELGHALWLGKGIAPDKEVAIELFARAADQGNLSSKKELKNIFCVFHAKATPICLSDEQRQTITILKNKLMEMAGFFNFLLGVSNAIESDTQLFGFNPHLKNISNQIPPLTNAYVSFLDHIQIPGFYVSVIQPSGDQPDLVYKLGPFNHNFVSWVGTDLCQKVLSGSDDLSILLSHLRTLNTTVLELIAEGNNSGNKLREMLETYEKLNYPTFCHIEAFLKPYFAAVPESKEREYSLHHARKLLEEKIQKPLENYEKFAISLREEIIVLMFKTEKYRNSLFKETYPWFFK